MAIWQENFIRCPNCNEGWTTVKVKYLLSKASSETNPVVIKKHTEFHCQSCGKLLSEKTEEGDNLNV